VFVVYLLQLSIVF